MMDKQTYFGKGCRFFVGQWESNDTEIPDYKDIVSPVLVFCNHKDNKSDVEGNCNFKNCPLKLVEKSEVPNEN